MPFDASTDKPDAQSGAASDDAAWVEVRDLSKRFGSVTALDGVNLSLQAGEVHGLLGDNGAGKSTLIKTLSGVFPADGGEIRIDGHPTRFRSPKDALDRGIATVYQDLALVPLLSVTRNFFLGRERTRGRGPFRRIDHRESETIARAELSKLGIDLEDMNQMVGTLSGGQRQILAIARAIHFGARLLILDEPTAALGVAQTALVLRTIAKLRELGVSVLLITHNARDALAVGERFTILDRGTTSATLERKGLTVTQLQDLMSGSGKEPAL